MNLPGSSQVALGKRFFLSLPWTQLEPRPGTATWAESGDASCAPQACGIGDRLRVVYTIDPRPVQIRELRPGARYRLTHLDPVTGTRTDAPSLTAGADGQARVEPPGHGHDWVVLVELVP
jgi:hypothetical protein